MRDGLVIRTGRGANLELAISQVDFVDEGSYSCRATLDDSSVIGPASAGELIVLGELTTLHNRISVFRLSAEKPKKDLVPIPNTLST